LLFVRFRRKIESLILQPCGTNPSVLCKHLPPRQHGWLEFNTFTALHWCHYQTKLAVRNGQKDPDSKREWEHHDRNKFGAFMKPVDECTWPKRTVWPAPSQSLTSFLIPNNGKSHTATSHTHISENKFSWQMSTKHPCFLYTVQCVLSEIEKQSSSSSSSNQDSSNNNNMKPASQLKTSSSFGGGVSLSGGGISGGGHTLDALMKASWIQNEWSHTQSEIDIMDKNDKKAKNDNGDKSDFARYSLLSSLELIKHKSLEAIDENGKCEESLVDQIKDVVRHVYMP